MLYEVITIFDNNGEFYSIIVAKSNETAPEEHKVDAISGVITSYSIHYTKLYDELPNWTTTR